MNTEENKYDKAIKYLTENPDQITNAWGWPRQHVAGCLFAFLGPAGTNMEAACPTMIKGGDNSFQNKLDKFVRAMNIPNNCFGIKVEHLPVFKTIQEEADRVYGRT
jgi:hypothetical protein